MRRFLMTLAMVMMIGPLYAQRSQEVIPLSSPVYEDMEVLYLATGNGTPSNAQPWTKGEASLILSRIDASDLSAPLDALHRSISQEIESGLRFIFSDGFQFDTSMETNFEFYWHDNTVDYDKDTEWIRGFEDRKPLVKLNLAFSLEDYLYIFTDLQYGRNRFTDRDKPFMAVGGSSGKIVGSIIESGDSAEIVDHSWAYSQRFLTNIMWPTYDIDFQTPKRAIASVGGRRWNFNLSRDKVKWGNGHSGNFIIDDHVDYQEFARFNAFSDHFKYEWLNVFFETNPSVGEGSSADEEFRMLMAHRLEFRILDIITFALSENIMYQHDLFSARYLNPAFIYHNLNSRQMFNAIAHAELDIAFAKGFNAYAQYVLDQAVAPNETASQADATGWLAGVEHAIPIGNGILSSSIEYAQTSPALYRREYVDFLMFRRYHGNGTSFISHIDYIGYQYGGDAQVVQLDLAYRLPAVARFALRLFGMRHGEVDWFTTNTAVNDIRVPSPSGNAIGETGLISMMAELSVPDRYFPWADVAVYGQLDLIGKRTYDKVTDTHKDRSGDVQLTVGMSFAL